MFLDTSGECGYRLRGRIPIRSREEGTWVPVDGSGEEHEWERMIPAEEMPAVRNPAEPPFAVTANQKVTTDDYPYVISQHYGSDHRARRVTERIEAVLADSGVRGVSYFSAYSVQILVSSVQIP
jgi:penicillin amidase